MSSVKSPNTRKCMTESERIAVSHGLFGAVWILCRFSQGSDASTHNNRAKSLAGTNLPLKKSFKSLSSYFSIICSRQPAGQRLVGPEHQAALRWVLYPALEICQFLCPSNFTPTCFSIEADSRNIITEHRYAHQVVPATGTGRVECPEQFRTYATTTKVLMYAYVEQEGPCS